MTECQSIHVRLNQITHMLFKIEQIERKELKADIPLNFVLSTFGETLNEQDVISLTPFFMLILDVLIAMLLFQPVSNTCKSLVYGLMVIVLALFDEDTLGELQV